MEQYLIVGNGVAGTTAAEHIRKQDKKGSIVIVTDEGLPFYYRIRLNEYISGEVTEQNLIAKKEQWYKDQGIDLRLNTRIQWADPAKKSSLPGRMRPSATISSSWQRGATLLFPPSRVPTKKGSFRSGRYRTPGISPHGKGD